ncbi:ATP-binding protein [Streptomyces sp. B93]|uniref:ATP-binding protein n=1 Tax=Streptomyces sp. B93 TaxID=2824875 RepID=UPI001B368E19|nr:ATP-binding protein [Streptomyces sp. B93]MBQ1089715.1 ATP-binding protein [Streptomyces sp. B93]
MKSTAPQLPTTVRAFGQLLSSTRRGARLGRLLAVGQLQAWDVSPTVIDRAEQIVAELAANAALHGGKGERGHDFHLALALDDGTGLLRIAVSDARGDVAPVAAGEVVDPEGAESGRGLVLVAALADRWGTEASARGGKTVWAELDTTM